MIIILFHIINFYKINRVQKILKRTTNIIYLEPEEHIQIHRFIIKILFFYLFSI